MSNPAGVYLHIPFCRSKCPYCDFYSVRFDGETADRYVNALINEISTAGDFKADTVYFGGGTPSLLGADRICRILSALSAHLTESPEITIECNPKTVDLVILRDFYTAGINRISLGVQSFDDSELKSLGRIHTADEAVQTVIDARCAGFENISIDLMLGTDNQTPEMFMRSVSEAVKLPITHISAYMLKVEPNTPYARRTLTLPDDDSVAETYLRMVGAFSDAGFLQYEISNFAKAGYECRHNIKYWDCGDYYGFGAAAHDHLNGVRACHNRDIDEYIKSGGQNRTVTEPNADGFSEYAMLRLRLAEGLDLNEVQKRYGINPDTLIKRAAPYEQHRLLKISDGRISLTPRGFLVSNELISRIVIW